MVPFGPPQAGEEPLLPEGEVSSAHGDGGGVLLRICGAQHRGEARPGPARCGAVRYDTVQRDRPTALQLPLLPLPWGQVPPLGPRGLASPLPRPRVAEGSDWAALGAEAR